MKKQFFRTKFTNIYLRPKFDIYLIRETKNSFLEQNLPISNWQVKNDIRVVFHIDDQQKHLCTNSQLPLNNLYYGQKMKLHKHRLRIKL